MTAPTLDPEQVAAATGQELAKVKAALAEMEPSHQEQVAKALGLDFLPIGAKRGRPRSPSLEIFRKGKPDWSPRTIARFDHAMRLLCGCGADVEAVISLYTRANGTVRVAALEAHAEVMADLRAQDQP
jgi:hypothetical protein